MFHLSCFGGLRLHPAGAATPTLVGHPKRLALLALLASAPDGRLARERVLLYLWPDSESDRARNALKQIVHRIRAEIGESSIVTTTAGDLRLDRTVVASDVCAFREAIQAGNLEKAAEIHVAPFLDGFYLRDAPEFERWAEEERQRLQELYCSVRERLALAAARNGNHAAAAGHWRVLATLDPLSSRIARAYISALVAAGERERALSFGAEYADLVRAELATEPDAALTQLLGEVRRSSSPPVGQSAVTPALEARRTSASGAPAHPVAGAEAASYRRRHFRRLQTLAVALGAFGLVMVAAPTWWSYGSPRISLGATQTITRDPGLELAPALSPDGSMVAYAANDAQERLRIFVRERNGGRAVQVSRNARGGHRSPRWSPDGTRILFSGDAGLWVVSRLGGDEKLVAPEGVYGDWSPDGKSIVYSGHGVIRVKPLDGESRLIVRRQSLVLHSPAWSPDGKWIVFVSGNPDFPGAAMPFADRAPSALHVVPATGGEPRQITDRQAMHQSPVWMSDSRGILFISTRDGGSDVRYMRLDRHGVPTGEEVRLTTDFNAGSISISRTGELLAYSAVISNEANIWRFPIADGRLGSIARGERITAGTQNVEAFSISPDGEWIAFDSERSGNYDIYKTRIGADEPVPVTTDSAPDFRPAWSPDGQWIAFQSWRNGTRDIYVTRADGEGTETLVYGSPGQDLHASWSPDSRSIVFRSVRDSVRNLSVVDRLSDGSWSEARSLGVFGGAPVFAPDGRVILFGNLGLQTVQPDGTNARRLLDSSFVHEGQRYDVSGQAVWIEDDRAILLRATAPGTVSFWRMAYPRGTPRPLLFLDRATHNSPRPEFATDGRYIYVTLANRQSDIRAVPLRSR